MPLAPGLPAAELQHVLHDSSASVLLASPALLKRASEVIEGLHPKPVLRVVESQRTTAISKDLRPLLKEDADVSAALMLYTSGTTSRPVCVAGDPSAAL